MGCSAKLNECIAFRKGGQRWYSKFPFSASCRLPPSPCTLGYFASKSIILISLQGDGVCKILIVDNLRAKYLFCWSYELIAPYQTDPSFNCTDWDEEICHVKVRDWRGFRSGWGLTRFIGGPVFAARVGILSGIQTG